VIVFIFSFTVKRHNLGKAIALLLFYQELKGDFFLLVGGDGGGDRSASE
jgi:hypothetical protein